MQIDSEASVQKELTHKISFRALADRADMQSISESMTSDVCFGMDSTSSEQSDKTVQLPSVVLTVVRL